MTFSDIALSRRLGKNNKLFKLKELIAWDKIRINLPQFHVNEVNPRGGRKAYDKLKMFKAILLGRFWENA